MSGPKRIQRKRTAGWRMPEGAVYVGRPSNWGNWYVVSTVGELYKGNARYVAALPAPGAHVVCAVDKWGHRSGSMWGGFASKLEATTFAVELHRRSLMGTRVDLDGLRSHEFYLEALRGKDLACWCPLDQPCHADVLLDLANR